MTNLRFSWCVAVGILCSMLVIGDISYGADTDVEGPPRTVHLLAGSGLSRLSDKATLFFPFRGGVLIRNVASIKQRPFHIGVQVEYDGSSQDASHTILFAPAFFNDRPSTFFGTSSHGLNIEGNVLHSLMRRDRKSAYPDLYVGLTAGAYHRTLNQDAILPPSTVIRRLKPDKTGSSIVLPFPHLFNDSRWNYGMGVIGGVMIKTPRSFSPFLINTATFEVRYRHIFNTGTGLIPGLKRADQFGFYISGMWKLW